MRTRRERPVKDCWPSWRYGPNGEKAIFQSEAEVPHGWAKKPQDAYIPEPPVVHNPEQLADELRARGIEVLGHWSAAYMRELLDQ